MLKLTQLTLRRGRKVLFSDSNLTLHRGQKVGMTGANGCGKSSLFALIRGELEVDAGECTIPPGQVIAHVAQSIPSGERSAIDYVLDGDRELRDLERQLQQAEAREEGTRIADLHQQLEHLDGYTARARAARLLNGLGFSSAEEQLPIDHFSGGWRMRLNLGQALMCRSDILLLDEPTNHLDLDTVIWLEGWLQSYPGTLLLISHDRDFLDKVAHHIVHLEQQQLHLYAGNYSDFEIQRTERLAQQQGSYLKQQREIADMQRFVDRFRAKASKARQAQSRLKALARMETIAPAHIDSPFHFSFRPPEGVPNPLLTLERLSAGYADNIILEGIDWSLQAEARIGLLGRNGAGKSTLIKTLAGEIPPVQGVRHLPTGLRIGYFAQQQVEHLSNDASPLLHLQRIDSEASEQQLRDYLGGFGFLGEMALNPVAPFSGGEKARLVLAMVVYQRPNLLLLDEPTNHLDLDMRHALTMALQTYEGAMLLVSHDRHLLRSVCDEFWLVADHHVTPFDGDLDDYRLLLASQSRAENLSSAPPPAGNSAQARKEQRKQEAEQRKQLQPLRKRLSQLEQTMEQLAGQQGELEQQLAAPELYEASGREVLKQLLLDKGHIDQRLAETEEQWLALGEELEDRERS